MCMLQHSFWRYAYQGQVLLFVYILYLLFQLKSHAYMYKSTPQHLIDEESHPGILADVLNSSSSSSGGSDSSSADSDGSSSSRNTTKRIRRAFRRKRRKSSASSKDTPSVPSAICIASPNTNNACVMDEAPTAESAVDISPMSSGHREHTLSGDEADVEKRNPAIRRKASRGGATISSRDFEIKLGEVKELKDKPKKKKKRGERPKHHSKHKCDEEKDPGDANGGGQLNTASSPRSAAQVSWTPGVEEIPGPGQMKGPFGMRHLSSAVRRTTSMPEMNRQPAATPQPAVPRSAQPLPHLMPNNQISNVDTKDIVDDPTHLSRTAAIILLVITTGLVAVCAEFLVGSINYLVDNSSLSQAFIGLIILPIVGNAAEHVTAVTMAAKNKMDLAVNVALGSSIQIALFVTPIIVLLGWALNTDMSLYFSLFETSSLFASAFIVNYLMIDGRSNYLEGALLIAAYVIIAVAAFFYPHCGNNTGSGPGQFSQTC